jgi:hypothetical protein
MYVVLRSGTIRSLDVLGIDANVPLTLRWPVLSRDLTMAVKAIEISEESIFLSQLQNNSLEDLIFKNYKITKYLKI